MKNFKNIALSIFIALVMISCNDCLDCQSNTDINLTVEFYTGNVLDSTQSYTASGPGYINGTLPNLMVTDMSDFLRPVSVREACGDDLKDINNSSVTFESVVGDSSALFKYQWTENWECK